MTQPFRMDVRFIELSFTVFILNSSSLGAVSGERNCWILRSPVCVIKKHLKRSDSK